MTNLEPFTPAHCIQPRTRTRSNLTGDQKERIHKHIEEANRLFDVGLDNAAEECIVMAERVRIENVDVKALLNDIADILRYGHGPFPNLAWQLRAISASVSNPKDAI